MTGLDQLLSEGLAYRLGWMLLHSLWQGAVVAGAFALALSVIPQRKANARYLAGCFSLLAVLVLCIATLVMVESPRRAAQSSATVVERVAHVQPARLDSPAGIASSDPAVLSGIAGSADAVPAESPRDRAVAFGRTTLAPFLPWFAWLWLLGVSALSMWRLGGLIATYRLRTIATAPASKETLALVTRLAKRLRVSRPIRVLQTVVLQTPAVIGHLRPVLLLPLSALTGLSAGAIEAIIAHELAHIRRHDYLVNLLQTVVETLLFHHPAVWWISRQIRVEREHCCDDLALAVCGDRLAYARALAGLGRLGDAGAGLAAAATGGSLLGRIRRIAGLPARDANPSSRWLAGALAMTIVVASTILAHTTTSTASSTESSPASATQPASAKPATAPTPVLPDAGIRSNERTPRSATLPAGPRPFDLRVIHRDTKQPLASVAIKFQIDNEKRKAVTDQDGRCHIELPNPEPEDFTITCSKEGMVNMYAFWYRYHYKLGIPAEFTIAMEPAVSIGGIVQDEQGKPISEVKVSVSLLGTSVTAGHTVYPQVRDVEVRTDAQGRWHFDAMPEKSEGLRILLMHPDYLSDTQFGDRPTPPIEQLRARTAVQVMKRGLTITGIVRDDKGKPISAATVSRNPRMRVMNWYKDEKTDAEGRFRFIGVPAGQMVLTVKASGYGPSLTQIQVGPSTPPIEVRMQPGKTLRGRVVDPQGKPIPGASAFPKTWRGYDVIAESLQTDTEGRFSLPDAPPDTIHFEFSKGGYLYHEQDLAAGDQELVITLRPSIRITGKVVDAATNEPIKKFTVVPGYTWDAAQKELTWDRNHAHAMVNGKFEYTFDDHRVTYALQIEAEGYKPAVSEQFGGDKTALIVDFKLERSAGLTGLVRTPEGTPAVGAEVIVGIKTDSVYVQDGRLPDHQKKSHVHVETDRDGRFKLSEPPEGFDLVVLHDRGYAEVKQNELTRPLEIKLQPWGRLEGTLMIGKKPSGNEKVLVSFPENGTHWAYDATTDESGKFSFDRLLPKRGQVARSIRGPEMPGGLFRTFPSGNVSIDVKADQTLRVTIGGTGRPVVGRAKLPEGIDRKVNWIWGGCRMTMAHDESTPRTAVYSTAGRLKSDGSFRLEDVPAGTYELGIYLEEPNPNDKNGMMKLVGMITQQVVVPEMADGRSDEALDLGEIVIKVR